MNSLGIAAVVLACSLLGAAAGSLLRGLLPEHHVSGDSRDLIKQCFGLISAMVALVLGLLVASAKSAFDSQTTGFGQLSTNVIVLDHALAQYGPEAEPVRRRLRRAVASVVDHLWPPDGSRTALGLDAPELTAEGNALYRAVHELDPKSDAQRVVRSQAIQVSTELGKTRWTLSQPPGPLLPYPFLVVLASWLAVLFGSYGLLTPRNGTVAATLVLGALSMAGALFLIVDLGEPLGGLIRVSGDSLRYALRQLGP